MQFLYPTTKQYPYDVRNDGTVPEVAYDGFLWCGVGQILHPDGRLNMGLDWSALEIPGHTRWRDRERYVIRIRPKSANEIYIADHAPYDVRRKELAAARPSTSYTREEMDDFCCARARTIVPIHEYTGGFTDPVVLVRRELGFDEVEVIGS